MRPAPAAARRRRALLSQYPRLRIEGSNPSITQCYISALCETHAFGRPQGFRLGAGAGHASPRGYLDLGRLTGRVRRGNREIRLGPTDFRLLEYLLEKPGRVFSRPQLLDLVWGAVGRGRRGHGGRAHRTPAQEVVEGEGARSDPHRARRRLRYRRELRQERVALRLEPTRVIPASFGRTCRTPWSRVASQPRGHGHLAV